MAINMNDFKRVLIGKPFPTSPERTLNRTLNPGAN